MFRVYRVRVAMPGADSPRTFYFKDKKEAQKCYDAHESADGIGWINVSDDFPLDMLSDGYFN